MNAHVAKLTFSELLIDICALAVAYSASNYLGWLIGHSALQGIMIYPAAGIAVAIMLGAGRRVWLGVLLGVVLLNLWIVLSPSASGGFGLQMQMPGIVALAATVQALLAVTLIRRRFGVTVNLTGSLDVITMLLYAGPVACAATATITGLGAYFHGLLPAGSAVEQGSKIWAGASLSVVAFLPLSLVTITPDNRQHGVLWKGAPLRHVLTPLASFVLLSGLFVTAFLANTINASNAQSHRKIFSLIVDRNVADIYREFGSFGAILDDTADRIGSHPHDKLQNWQQFLQPSMLYGLHGLEAIGRLRLNQNSTLLQEITPSANQSVAYLEIGPDQMAVFSPEERQNSGKSLRIVQNKSVRTAMRVSLETGHPIAAQAIVSFGARRARSRIILLQPISADGASKNPDGGRLSDVQGWAFVVVDPNRLFPPPAPYDLGVFLERLKLHDSIGGEKLLPTTFFDAAGTTPSRHHGTSDLVKFGRKWSLIWASTRGFDATANQREGWITLIGGALVTMLVTCVIQLLSGREKRVRLEVGRRTSELAYELRKSKSIVENAAIAILLLGADGTVLFANSASEPLLAVSIPEILNRKIGSVLQDEFIESYLEVSEAGQAVSAEKQIQVKLHSGSLRWFEVRMSSFESETGNPTVTVILKDVTDAVEAHYNLEASERRWNMALEGSQIGVFDMDLAKGKAIASDAWRRLAGFPISAEVDIQAEWEARVHPEDLVKVKQADQECLDGKVDSVFVEYRLKRLDGVWRWMRGSARVVDRDAQGRPLRFLGTMMDITELRNAIDKARTEEDNLSALIETAPVGMAVLGLDGSFLMANNAFCQFTGYSKDILARTSLQDLQGAEHFRENRDAVRQLIRRKSKSYLEENRFVRPDGTVVWGFLSGTIFHGSGDESPRFIAQVQDITEAKQMEAMKGDFVATVSHELRTPLTSINGALGLVLGAMSKELPTKATHLLSVAQRNGERLLHLVNELLDMQNLSSGSFELRPDDVEVGDLVTQATEEARCYASRFNVTLQPVLPPKAIGARLDGHRFKQVVSNFISNAAKFSNEGEAIRISLEQCENEICVAVTDHGRGIPSDFQDKIFRPFSQAAAASTRDREGSGLGLAISKEIVERMGGTIGFTSEPNVNTTFWFRIPIERTDETSVA